jgi:alkanesulfonate monooxygenase SsuD/methylene tetrahydromethanopterin reductase-like flavin-dependent oxidoreductase (luciferase family)
LQARAGFAIYRQTFEESAMEIGLYSFAENTPDPLNGGALQSPAERLRDLLEEIELADQVGLDFYGLGEHHRPDFVASAPVTILAAAAARTKNIRLSTAVTVLSSDDPIRVYQQFSTLDLISNGRAEIMAGRGSFIESFPLFGYELEHYDDLFEEKLAMLLKIREGGKVEWPGSDHTRPIPGISIYPKPIQDPLPLWIAVGGTPNSVARAAYYGLPLMLAIIGGNPQQFQPFVELYRATANKSGHDSKTLPVGISSHGFLAEIPRTPPIPRSPPITKRCPASAANAAGRPRPAPSSTPAPVPAAPISSAPRSRSSTRY